VRGKKLEKRSVHPCPGTRPDHPLLPGHERGVQWEQAGLGNNKGTEALGVFLWQDSEKGGGGTKGTYRHVRKDLGNCITYGSKAGKTKEVRENIHPPGEGPRKNGGERLEYYWSGSGRTPPSVFTEKNSGRRRKRVQDSLPWKRWEGEEVCQWVSRSGRLNSR